MICSLAMKAGADKLDLVRERMRDVDRTLLRENLKLTPAQRLEKLVRFARFTSELRDAGKRARTAASKEREG
jgi:hypothetical protein